MFEQCCRNVELGDGNCDIQINCGDCDKQDMICCD